MAIVYAGGGRRRGYRASSSGRADSAHFRDGSDGAGKAGRDLAGDSVEMRRSRRANRAGPNRGSVSPGALGDRARSGGVCRDFWLIRRTAADHRRQSAGPAGIHGISARDRRPSADHRRQSADPGRLGGRSARDRRPTADHRSADPAGIRGISARSRRPSADHLRQSC